MRRATIKAVAKLAGVSLGTVSRVLNGNETVGAEIRRKVEAAIAKLEYQPDSAAQSMRSQSSKAIGIIVRDLLNPSFGAFVRSAQTIFYDYGYTLIIACSENSVKREINLLHLLSRRKIEGLLTMSASDQDSELLDAYRSLKVPIVSHDRDAPLFGDIVRLDHFNGVVRALNYLFDLGHRRIGMITGDVSVRPGRERLRAFREAHLARGITIDERLVRLGRFSAESGLTEASSLLGFSPRPTAIIAGGASILPGTLQALRIHGLGVGRDISLVACGTSDLAEHGTPRITAVHWDYANLGDASARLLLDRIVQKADMPARHLMFPTQLVIRESCRAINEAHPG